MSLEHAWVVAEVTWGLAAIGTAAVSWSIWRRAPGGAGTTWICASLVALATHYGLQAVDAGLHAEDPTTVPFTVWSALGRSALTATGVFVLLFLLSLLRTLDAPVMLRRSWYVRAFLTHGFGAAGFALSFGLQLVWDVVRDAPPNVIAASIARVTSPLHSGLNLIAFSGTMTYCAAVLARVPTARALLWDDWLARGGPWTLVIAPRTGASSEDSAAARLHQARWVTIMFSALLLGVGHHGSGTTGTWTIGTIIVTVYGHLALAPLLLGLVYCHAKPVFYDVVLKQGVLTVLCALATAIGISGLWALTLRGHSSALGPIAIGAAVLVCVAPHLYRRGAEYLDRRLFGRPDYCSSLRDLSNELAKSPDPATLVATAVSQLRATLPGTPVRKSDEPGQPHEVSLPLGACSSPRGYLVLGPRHTGQPYGSEDLTFLDAVAAQVAGRLDALRVAEAQLLVTTAELKALRAQINPHFLFNALTTIAEMAHAVPNAERAVLNLSRIFHYALDSTTHDRLPLRTELDAIRAYLELEAERFGDRVRVVIDVPADIMDTPMPPMLLQPLVENAIRHGLAGRDGGGTLHIRATKDDRQVRLMVEDDGVGFDPATVQPRVGLANVRARVDRIGGWCRVESGYGQGTSVTLGVVTA